MLKGAKAYQGQKIIDRNARVAKYAPLVKRVALHLKARLPPQVDVNDLIQSGMIGLIDALQNFKDGQGASFETYAAIRIRGAIIDELRQSDWTPRSVHQNTRAIREAMTRLSHQLGRPASDVEIAADLKVDINKYHQMLLDSNTSQVMGIEDTGLTDDVIGDRPLSEIVGQTPDDKLYDSIYAKQFQAALANAIANLPERERNIVTFYYDQELNLREIGLIMGISESRTCQVLSQALMRLRNALDEWSSASSKEKRVAPKKEELFAPGVLPESKPEKTGGLLFTADGEINFSKKTAAAKAAAAKQASKEVGDSKDATAVDASQVASRGRKSSKKEAKEAKASAAKTTRATKAAKAKEAQES